MEKMINETPFLSIIMPCYKGEGFIEESIETVEKEVSLFERKFELIVVIDGFVDAGYKKAKSLEEKFKNLKVVGYEKNKGKGYAIRYGLGFAKGEYVGFLDSDLDYHPIAPACYWSNIPLGYLNFVLNKKCQISPKRNLF